MPSTQTRKSRRRPDVILTADPDAPMTSEQAAVLKELARDAYELDAFKHNLTQADAALRIAMLRAKLRLLDEPPHTL